MNMETYHAGSMDGWLHGDAFGGYYDSFVNDKARAFAACRSDALLCAWLIILV